MGVDPATLGQNLYLIIGLVLCATFGLVLLIVAAIGVKWLIWQARRRHAQAAERKRLLRPDGRPYPPSGRGICSACQRAKETVYHLPDGRKLCQMCLEAADPVSSS